MVVETHAISTFEDKVDFLIQGSLKHITVSFYYIKVELTTVAPNIPTYTGQRGFCA